MYVCRFAVFIHTDQVGKSRNFACQHGEGQTKQVYLLKNGPYIDKKLNKFLNSTAISNVARFCYVVEVSSARKTSGDRKTIKALPGPCVTIRNLKIDVVLVNFNG